MNSIKSDDKKVGIYVCIKKDTFQIFLMKKITFLFSKRFPISYLPHV